MHFNLYYDSNCKGIPQPDNDAYTIVHELGHTLWNLGDEYKEPPAPGNPEPPANCEDGNSTSASYSLMDNFFKRGGNQGSSPPGTGTYTLNEFCVASNHDPDGDTVQQHRHGKSCRETMAEHPLRPVTLPTGLPIGAPPSVDPPEFETSVVGDRIVVLCIDRSGSMSNPASGGGRTRLALAKQAAVQFIDLLEVGDRIAITSFEGVATVDYPLTEITGDAERTAAKSAVNALVASGGTCAGSGLSAAMDEITSLATPSCDQSVIFLTDGQFDSGTCSPIDPAAALAANGIAVFAIGIGQDVSMGTLTFVARVTSGDSFWLKNAEELPILYLTLSSAAAGSGALIQASGFVSQGQTSQAPVFVDELTQEATFAITWTNTGDDLDLTLESPSSVTITPASEVGNTNIDFISTQLGEAFRIKGDAMEPGTWIIKVHGASVGSGIASGEFPNGSFQMLALSDTDDALLGVSKDRRIFAPGESIQLTASPQYLGRTILGANVSGRIPRADGTIAIVQFVDNGDTTRGDIEAGDGVYSAIAGPYFEPGAFAAQVASMAVNASTHPGESLFADVGAPSASVAAPDLARVSGSIPVVLTGDCNLNGIEDFLDIFNGTSQDCNSNLKPDSCDIASGFSLDANSDGVPDECVGGPPNNACSNAITVTGSVPFSTINASTDGCPEIPCAFGDIQGGITNDIWFRYVPPCTGQLTVSTCFTANFPTKIAVYSYCGCEFCGEYGFMGCAGPGTGCGDTAQLTVPVEIGHCYKIRVGGKQLFNPPHPTGSGLLAISMHCDGDEECPGDVTYNGNVDTDDLLTVINAWGLCPLPLEYCPADVAPPGGSGSVDVDDLLAVLNDWGPCP